RQLIPCLSFVVCCAAPLAGQATDSLSAARRVVAAVSLAAKEYRIGVPGAPGRVTVAEEVDEARQFIEQARFDVPFLPRAARSATAGVFTTVRHQLDSAVAARSDRLVFSAYLTFEQVETDLRARNPGLTTRLEGGFARLQARAAAGADGAELEALHRALLADLERAERIVSDRGSGANLLVQSLMLMVREGF